MHKIGDFVVYRKEVCIIKEIRKNHISNKDYYIMNPVYDSTLKIDVPTDNKSGYIRDVISKKDALKLIEKIESIDIIECNDKDIEREYKKLLEKNSLENLIKIIKTTYLRNEKRINNKKRISEKDESYFKRAEKQLYEELSISLNMTPIQVKEYIINYIEKK